MTTKQYPEADPQALGRYYLTHIKAMTEESLDSKSDIAIQLALRDKRYDELVAAARGVVMADTYVIIGVARAEAVSTAIVKMEKLLPELPAVAAKNA